MPDGRKLPAFGRARIRPKKSNNCNCGNHRLPLPLVTNQALPGPGAFELVLTLFNYLSAWNFPRAPPWNRVVWAGEISD